MIPTENSIISDVSVVIMSQNETLSLQTHHHENKQEIICYMDNNLNQLIPTRHLSDHG